MKVAILQNSIGIGGRSKVIAEAIRTLSVRGVEIELLTLSNKKRISEFKEYYDLEAYEISLHQYQDVTKLLPGTLYQQLGLNWIAKDDIRKYDFVFNSNNCLRFLPENPKYMHYIHLPVPKIPEVNERYNSSLLLGLYQVPMRIIQHLYEGKSRQGVVITNSQFTAYHYKQAYGSPPDEIIYPPSIESVDFESFSGDGVASLGSFHPNKRQLFQIQVAEQLPDIPFTIIGNSASSSYYHRCVQYINANNINNVTLRKDASPATINNVLNEKRIFLHSMKNEPFGISTVEALNSGCIPVTHDSGGQKEVIPDSRFRYRSKSECIKVIKRIEEGEQIPDQDKVINRLEDYTVSSFRSDISNYLNHV